LRGMVQLANSRSAGNDEGKNGVGLVGVGGWVENVRRLPGGNERSGGDGCPGAVRDDGEETSRDRMEEWLGRGLMVGRAVQESAAAWSTSARRAERVGA
jgi:hypothetical protein